MAHWRFTTFAATKALPTTMTKRNRIRFCHPYPSIHKCCQKRDLKNKSKHHVGQSNFPPMESGSIPVAARVTCVVWMPNEYANSLPRRRKA
mmetsp:Transcript_6472/g.18537  ORF Transcript_6472/g.18537 Transcript_6472/m.18537 type:complete len:91 (-) Transcript_6472:344-616(-)